MSDDPQPQDATPSLFALFGGFFEIGMLGFGGVLPWARRMVVEQRRWLTASEFTDLLALCQFLPGPNICNMSVALGARFHGVAGAAACFSGLMAAPTAIVLALGVFYSHFSDVPAVQHGFAGLAAAASGLIIAMAVKISAPLRGDWPAIGVALVTFAIIALLRPPLLQTLLVLAPLSVVLLWWLRGRADRRNR